MPSAKTVILKPQKTMPTTAARDQLPSLVEKARSVTRASESLARHAVDIGPYNKGGAWLIPEVDVQAAVRREERLKERISHLEAELERVESLALLELVRERVTSEEAGSRISGIEFIRELGNESLADELERSRHGR